jgi:hypothetical protein
MQRILEETERKEILAAQVGHCGTQWHRSTRYDSLVVCGAVARATEMLSGWRTMAVSTTSDSEMKVNLPLLFSKVQPKRNT